MKHAPNLRSAHRQRHAAGYSGPSGELRRINPDTYRPRSRYGHEANTVPDVDREERDDAREWDES